MKLLVIGAAGRTGRRVLDQGVCRGHLVTAFARRPAELAGVDGLRAVFAGDATKLDDVLPALTDQDCVIAAVGGAAIARTLIAARQAALNDGS